MTTTTTEVSITSNDDCYVRHVRRDRETSLEIAAFRDKWFAIQVIDSVTAITINKQTVVLSREEFKVLREHVNDPDVLAIFA